jgi:hypothetical protein
MIKMRKVISEYGIQYMQSSTNAKQYIHSNNQASSMILAYPDLGKSANASS